jgi:isoleucyl-tRNA synthetase
MINHEIDQKEDKNNVQFPEFEKEVIEFWKSDNSFIKSIENKKESPIYSFYDGPPFANGLPHYGHLLTGFIKDTDARYRTMRGHYVPRNFGWDCHGLPVEMEIEKMIKVSGQQGVKKFGISKFNVLCRDSAMKYSSEWEFYVNRQARWVDFTNDYKTMNNDYMESVIWAFKTLYDKNLVYQDSKVVPYSWKCETPLSNFETRMDNSYRNKESKSLFVKFEIDEQNQSHKTVDLVKKIRQELPNINKIYFLVWTTTPWTLPSNLALAVKEDVDYVAVEKDGDAYIVAEVLQNKIFNKK